MQCIDLRLFKRKTKHQYLVKCIRNETLSNEIGDSACKITNFGFVLERNHG